MTDDPDTIRIEDTRKQELRSIIPQVLIALIERVGGECFIHLSEIAAADRSNLAMRVSADGVGIYFRVTAKGSAARADSKT